MRQSRRKYIVYDDSGFILIINIVYDDSGFILIITQYKNIARNIMKEARKWQLRRTPS